MDQNWPLTYTVFIGACALILTFNVLSKVTHIPGTCVVCIFTWDKAVLQLWWVFEEAVNSSCLHFVVFRWLPLQKARAHLAFRKCSQLTVNSICVWCKANCKETASYTSCSLGVSELADWSFDRTTLLCCGRRMRCEYGQAGCSFLQWIRTFVTSTQHPHFGAYPTSCGMTLNPVMGPKMAWIYASVNLESFRMWRDVEIAVFLDFKLSPFSDCCMLSSG